MLISHIDGTLSRLCFRSYKGINPLGLSLDAFLAQWQLTEEDADTGDKGVILMQVTVFFYHDQFHGKYTSCGRIHRVLFFFFFFPGCKASYRVFANFLSQKKVSSHLDLALNNSTESLITDLHVAKPQNML